MFKMRCIKTNILRFSKNVRTLSEGLERYVLRRFTVAYQNCKEG